MPAFSETLRVIRVDPQTKRPMRADWPAHALPWSSLVAGWGGWAAPQGPINGSWVLDVDPKNEGDKTLAKLIAQHGELPATRVASTRSGGLHYWFRWDDAAPVANTTGRLPGLDTRGPNGYVIIPPTQGYTWSVDAELAEAPAWLVALFAARPKLEGNEERPVGLVGDANAAREYFARFRGPDSGQASDWYWDVAMRAVRGFGLTPDVASALIHEVLIPKCDAAILDEDHGGLEHALERAESHSDRTWGFMLAPAEAPKTPPPSTFDVPVDTFLAERIDPPRDIVWKLQSAQMAFLYGGANSSKTWMALDLSRQAANSGKRVLYVVEEGHPAYLQRRFRWLGLSGPNVHVAVRKGLNLRASQWLDMLVARVLETRTDLLVIDPLSDCLDGVDESDPKEMHAVRDALKRLVGTGACVLVLHHASKLGSRQGGVHDAGMAMENMRGHSILAGAADLMVELRRMKDEEGVSEVEITKNRNGPLEHGGRLELHWHADRNAMEVAFLPGDRGLAKTEVIREQRKAERKDERDEARLDEQAQSVTNAFAKWVGGKSIREIAKSAQMDPRTVKAALVRLRSKGIVRQDENGLWWAIDDVAKA